MPMSSTSSSISISPVSSSSQQERLARFLRFDPQKNDPTNLYVRNLPKDCSQVALDNLFSEFGQIVESRVWRRREGFVRLESHEHCIKAIKTLTGLKHTKGCPPLQVQFAQKKRDVPKLVNHKHESKRSAHHQPNKTNVYIGNLPPNCTDEDHLRHLVADFGRVKACRLLSPNHHAGFVRFAHASDAQSAITRLNGRHLNGSQIPLVVKLANDDPFRSKRKVESKRMNQQEEKKEFPPVLDMERDSSTSSVASSQHSKGSWTPLSPEAVSFAPTAVPVSAYAPAVAVQAAPLPNYYATPVYCVPSQPVGYLAGKQALLNAVMWYLLWRNWPSQLSATISHVLVESHSAQELTSLLSNQAELDRKIQNINNRIAQYGLSSVVNANTSGTHSGQRS